MALTVKPQGFAANLMLGVALKTMPGIEQQIIDGLEANLDDLARELAKPDPRGIRPPGSRSDCRSAADPARPGRSEHAARQGRDLRRWSLCST